ncbi:MAG: alpha/beta hydrolase [Kiritimatiellae bacterium]|nr:alpha/beta hydrolase [Kiritimatiellia bacterium]
MTGRTLLCVALLAALAAGAGERVKIWPEGRMPDAQPHQIAAMTDEAGAPGFDAAAHRDPYLEWLDRPQNPNGCCMILISGGGYFNCCDVGLVKMWAEKFTAAGFQCVNFVYRTPRPEGLPFYRSAWEDGQRAVRLVRSQAAARGFDPERIGTMSMSAGSHLATLLATSSQTPAYERVDDADDVPCHIAWAITGAIAYAMTDGLGIPNTRNGQAVDAKLDDVFKFDAKTAPMCMFHGSADKYSPTASTFVYRELRKRKVPAELHLFADRPHGFWGVDGRGDAAAAYDNWFDRAMEFLAQMGFVGPLAPEEDLMERFAADFHDPAKYAKENIWPDGKTPDLQDGQNVPYIEWYIPAKLTTKAVQIIYSGGSYMGNSPDGFEVAPARRFLNGKGMAVVTMKYRTPRPAAPLAKHTTAWQDLQRCIRIVRSKAEAKGLDPNRIGIMGSSAGGHLTLMGVTSSRSRSYWDVDEIDKLPCNVQWGVGIYPAYALTDGAEKPNAGGGNDDSARPVPEFAFDQDTCPMVFVHGDADGWAAMNSVKTWEQMRRMGIGSDLHTLCLRPHCFQRKASPGTGSYTWLGRIWEFMNHKGFNK